MRQRLLSKKIPIVQPLHFHQVMVDNVKIGDHNDDGHHRALTISSSIARLSLEKYGGSARALNAGKPVKKPQAHRAGNVKNHLAELDLSVVLYRVHVVSLP
jgi:hypothetical protein